jgi:hypothetical protein
MSGTPMDGNRNCHGWKIGSSFSSSSMAAAVWATRSAVFGTMASYCLLFVDRGVWGCEALLLGGAVTGHRCVGGVSSRS